MKTALKYGLAVGLALTLASDVDARELTSGSFELAFKMTGKIYDDDDKVVAKAKDASTDVGAFNSLLTFKLRYEIGATLYNLPGEFTDESDRKSGASPDGNEVGELNAFYGALGSGTTWKGKKPKVGFPDGVDFTSVEVSGKFKVNKKFQKPRLKLKYTVEGTITAGPNAGQTFRGKIKIKGKGDRTD